MGCGRWAVSTWAQNRRGDLDTEPLTLHTGLTSLCWTFSCLSLNLKMFNVKSIKCLIWFYDLQNQICSKCLTHSLWRHAQTFWWASVKKLIYIKKTHRLHHDPSSYSYWQHTWYFMTHVLFMSPHTCTLKRNTHSFVLAALQRFNFSPPGVMRRFKGRKFFQKWSFDWNAVLSNRLK